MRKMSKGDEEFSAYMFGIRYESRRPGKIKFKTHVLSATSSLACLYRWSIEETVLCDDTEGERIVEGREKE